MSAIEHLVLASGGHIRDLFNLVRELLNHAMQTGLPIPPEAIEAAIRNVSQDRGVLFRGTVELLNHVRRSESLATLDEGLLGALAAAMDQYLVLSYRNGEVWYGVHPLIASGLDEALRALEREGREN
ncbi:MAG: hypothetical protein HY791_12575 [Deltaproteobacteria bacterium]|nr:hypothetical protein [Deltaproteobacteria bacterium]